MIALARASKRAGRYLRGLSPADREDVLSGAILWCWENKATYDPAVALDDWFVGAIRNALRDWSRGEGRNKSELVTEMLSSDDPVAHTEAIEAVEAVAQALSPREQQIAELVISGHSRREIRDTLAVGNDEVAAIRVRLAGLRHLMPDTRHMSRIIRSARTLPAQDLAEGESPKAAGIDREIERLDFAPPSGADCPPCWKCRWFDGFLPMGTKATGMIIAEPEVRNAVAQTEARKIQIANEVRA